MFCPFLDHLSGFGVDRTLRREFSQGGEVDRSGGAVEKSLRLTFLAFASSQSKKFLYETEPRLNSFLQNPAIPVMDSKYIKGII